LILLLAGNQCLGTTYSKIYPGRLVDESPLIIKATVTAHKDSVAVLHVDKVLKGTLRATEIRIPIPDPAAPKPPAGTFEPQLKIGTQSILVLNKPHANGFYFPERPQRQKPVKEEAEIAKLIAARLRLRGGPEVEGLTLRAELVEDSTANWHLEVSLKNVSSDPITVCPSSATRPLQVAWTGPDGKTRESRHYARDLKSTLHKSHFITLQPGEVRFVYPFSTGHPICFRPAPLRTDTAKFINPAAVGRHAVVVSFENRSDGKPFGIPNVWAGKVTAPEIAIVIPNRFEARRKLLEKEARDRERQEAADRKEKSKRGVRDPKPKPAAALTPFSRDGKFGFRDSRGKVVIQPKFERVLPFAEGRALVMVGKPLHYRWGYIDRAGQYVVRPKYKSADSYSEGLAAITVWKPDPDGEALNPHAGYIDLAGKVIIPPTFMYAGRFSHGMAAVQDRKTRLCGYIDRSGKFAIKPTWPGAEPFIDGLARVTLRGSWWGKIDLTGKLVWDNVGKTPGIDLAREIIADAQLALPTEKFKLSRATQDPKVDGKAYEFEFKLSDPQLPSNRATVRLKWNGTFGSGREGRFSHRFDRAPRSRDEAIDLARKFVEWGQNSAALSVNRGGGGQWKIVLVRMKPHTPSGPSVKVTLRPKDNLVHVQGGVAE
jgi:hypothetical protein